MLPLQKEETRLNNALALETGRQGAGNQARRRSRKRSKALDPILTAYRPLKDKAKFGESNRCMRCMKPPTSLNSFRSSNPVFKSVHEPHPIKWGNTFASIYFLMTGFHALHVVIGMIMFGIIIWLGMSNKLGPAARDVRREQRSVLALRRSGVDFPVPVDLYRLTVRPVKPLVAIM